MGKMNQNPVSAWKEKIEWSVNSSYCRELDQIDGEPMEFESKNFLAHTTLQILAEIQKLMTDIQCELVGHFFGRFIFMSMYSDIVW